MRTTLHATGVVLALLLTTGLLGAESESNDTLEKFRASFEKRMNAELDEHGEKARNLRQSYLDALQRLKADFGRQENLKAAAQAVAEIEAIEDGEEAKLPEDADYRLKRLRKTWDEGLEKILRERSRKIQTTANLYLKALDNQKRKLTRAGRIKEALRFEEEAERVKELPEVKATVVPADVEAKIVEGDVALASRGARVTGAQDARKMIDGDSVGDPKTHHHGRYASARWPCEIVVDLGELYKLNRIRFRLYDDDKRTYKFRVAVSGTEGDWEPVADKSQTGGSSWQNIEFQPKDIRYIRLEGLHNTANERFHVIELEAYCPGQ